MSDLQPEIKPTIVSTISAAVGRCETYMVLLTIIPWLVLVILLINAYNGEGILATLLDNLEN